ncbi:hypothetical protein PRUPE_8G155200 [Prunus persica]|uniref:Uncharacterized protein n=1 Tax=Prunus persica TaxID=3760 RepID=A0A251MYD8_PRUPE|nr:hypothetical protein PRUPE_8G155200 [Prunus persica]
MHTKMFFDFNCYCTQRYSIVIASTKSCFLFCHNIDFHFHPPKHKSEPVRRKHSSRQALKKLHALLSRSRMGAIAFAPTAASYFLLFSTKILCRNGRLSMISYISVLPHTFLFAKDKPQQNN